MKGRVREGNIGKIEEQGEAGRESWRTGLTGRDQGTGEERWVKVEGW